MTGEATTTLTHTGEEKGRAAGGSPGETLDQSGDSQPTR